MNEKATKGEVWRRRVTGKRSFEVEGRKDLGTKGTDIEDNQRVDIEVRGT